MTFPHKDEIMLWNSARTDRLIDDFLEEAWRDGGEVEVDKQRVCHEFDELWSYDHICTLLELVFSGIDAEW